LLVVMAIDPARHARNGPPLLKLWIIPVRGFAAWRMVRIGGRRRLGAAKAPAYRDEF
jgi:hypothetical protein